jgi:hypothetical protein
VTNASLTSVPPTDAAAATAPRLRGHWLVVARIAWVAAMLLAIAFDAAILLLNHAYLRVVGPAIPCDVCGPLNRLGPADVQTLHQLGLSVDAFAWFVVAVQLLVMLGFGAVGAVLFWRASAHPVALLASLTLVLFPTTFSVSASPLGLLPQWFVLFGNSLAFLSIMCVGLFFCVFPSGRFAPRWTRWLLLAWAAYWACFYSLPNTFVLTAPSFAIQVCLAIGVVAAQVYRYRCVSTPAQRQQTKWVVLGTALAFGGYQATFLVVAVFPTSVFAISLLANDLGYIGSTLFWPFLPLSIGIALLRYRLFDIDVIIRRTLLYGSLTALLGALYFGMVVGVQTVVGAVDPQAAQFPVIIVATTLLIAAVFTPLRQRIQNVIDRRFYRAKYDAARTLEAFATSLRTETDLAELSEQLMTVVQETMQPASVSLWLAAPGRPRGNSSERENDNGN